MAMLAGPRKRRQYNLTPRGKPLFEDGSRLGTKMMQKMGWSKGKGLGVNESGNVDFVRVRYKKDAEGIGYEMRDDQWTEQEQNYNNYLKSLNEGKQEEKAADDDGGRCAGFGFGFQKQPAEQKLKESTSGVSLEQKSKMSRARVHYKKSVRGKDVSQYSEKDLANIFGKKHVEEVAKPVEEAPKVGVTAQGTNFNGVQTISAGLSVEDYFKQKMAALKNRANLATVEQLDGANATNNEGQDSEEQFSAKESSKKKRKQPSTDEEAAEVVNVDSDAEPVSKPKKSKNRDKHQQSVADVKAEENAVQNEAEPATSKKQKKIKKHAKEEVEEVVAVNTMDNLDASTTEKHKKLKKSERQQKRNKDNEADKTLEIAVDEEKSKPSKRKREEGVINMLASTEAAVSVEDSSAKKSKNVQALPTENIDAVEATSERKGKDKKRKNPDEVHKEVTQDLDCCQAGIEPGRKKRKKNRNESLVEQRSDLCIEQAAVVVVEPTKQNTKEQEASTQNKKKKKKNKKEKNEPNAESTGDGNSSPTDLTSKSTGSQALPLTSYIEDLTAAFGTLPLQTANAMMSSYIAQAKRLSEATTTLRISAFCAEKFRLLDLSRFPGANFAQINGYGLSKDAELKIHEAPMDAQRILSLWASENSKYSTRQTYREHMNAARQTFGRRLTKKSVKALKKKHVF